MNATDRYVARVLDGVFASREKAARLEADLRARFAQGEAEGESPAMVAQRLGPAEELAEAFMADVDLEYAGFWERTFAFLADVGLCFAVVTPFLVAGAWMASATAGPPFSPDEVASFLAVPAMVVAVLAVFVLYFPVLESRFGRTLGKRLMGLHVRTESGAGIGLGVAFLRRLPMYFEFLVPDALFVPFTRKKQRAFDIVAKTVVVRDPDAERGPGSFLSCIALFLVPAVALVVGAVLLGPVS